MPSNGSAAARSPTRTSMPAGSSERSLLGRARTTGSRSARRAATKLPRKPVAPTSRIRPVTDSHLLNDVAQQVQVARREGVAVIVLLGKGAAATAELSAQGGISAQLVDGARELVAALRVDQQRDAWAGQDRAGFAAHGADDGASGGEDLEQLRGDEGVEQRHVAQRHQAYVGSGVQAR